MNEALQHLHAHGVVHVDLKLENWVWKGRWKLVDLGGAFRGTPGFVAIRVHI